MKVFLSHNSDDKQAVEVVAERLSDEGMEPWFDKWRLIPGDPWQKAIEEALESCDCCLVFIGPSGIGPWQHEEMRAAIDRRVNEPTPFHVVPFRVVPVLLPRANRPERLPAFLVAATWVEFRGTLDDDDAYHRLLCGIRGIPPGPGPNEAEPTGTPIEQLNLRARERLRGLAERVLQSDVARAFILACNELSDTMSAKELASEIFQSDEPMTFLRRCVRQEQNKASLDADQLAEVKRNICRLVELVVPVCFRQDDITDLERHLEQQASHANMATGELTVAKSRVAFIKRVSVDLDDGCDWTTVDESHLPSGRESVAAMPHPPELGIFSDGGDGRDDIVDAFTEALIRILQPESRALPRVQAALKDLAEIDKVFLCVLFPLRLSDENLRRLNATFAELILIIANQPDDSPHQRILDQIQRIRAEFGPSPGNCS